MDAPTLGSIFARHARFPSSGKATLSVESFAERLAERSHGLDREARDPMAWVEHFFELEHSFERRAEEFDLAGALTHHGETVLQFELAEREFVVIDGEDDIVVASNAGSVVVSRTSALARSLRAAELPSRQQVSPSASYKPAGERAYFVTQSGAVTSVDAKLVAAALKGAQLRPEPLARVAQAPQRLAAFSPIVVRPKATPVKFEPVRQVAAFAKSAKAGDGPTVLIVERESARNITGDRARFWSRLASTMTEGGRHSESKGRAAGAVSGKATSVESFTERLAERGHSLHREARDPMAWVEHFFAYEHSFERRAEEFDLAAALAHHGETVLQFELAEREFVVIDGAEDIVVASNAGSVVISRTSELARSLRAAELPSRQQVSPSASYKPAGERAYFVTQSGAVTSVDAKLVAAALKGAQLRPEPLARVAQAPQRLAAFSPIVVRPKATPVKSEPVRQVAAFAKSVKADDGPKVLIVERESARNITGDRARFWSRLASTMTEGGRHTESKGRAAGAVAVGRQTFAVKAGGVTALVQKPVEGIGRRIDNVARRQAVVSERRVESLAPRWVREAVAERPNGRGFWVPVNAAPASTARPAWVAWALAEARDARSRARAEIAGRMDPARIKVPLITVPRTAAAPVALINTPRGLITSTIVPSLGVDRDVTGRRVTVGAAPIARALAPAGMPEFASLDMVLPQIRIVEGASSTTIRAPITSVGGLPATTLRALYTGLERTADIEGNRLPPMSANASEGLRLDGRRDSRATVRAELEELRKTAGGEGFRSPSISTNASEGLLFDGRRGSSSTVLAEHEELRIEAAPPRLSGGGRSTVFSLPFTSDAGVRVGADLDTALGSLTRRLEVGRHPVPTAAGQDGPLPNRASDILYSARPMQMFAAAPMRLSSSTRVDAARASLELESFAVPAAATESAVPRSRLSSSMGMPAEMVSPELDAFASPAARALTGPADQVGRLVSSTRSQAAKMSPELDTFATPAARAPSGSAAPGGSSSPSWVDWAIRNSSLARAHGRGVSIAQTPSIGSHDFAVGAPAGSSGPASSATSAIGAPKVAARNAALPAGTTSFWPSEQRAQAEAAQRFPSMFIRFDAEPGSQGPRPLRAMRDVVGPEIGLFAVPMTHDSVIDAASPSAVFNPQAPASRPMVPGRDGRPQRFVEGTWLPAAGSGPSVAIRLAPLYLQDVNARRVPSPVANSPRFSAALEGSAEEIVVPVPLWMQMADTIQPSFVSTAGLDPTRSALFQPSFVSAAGTDPTRSAPAVVSRAGTDPTRSAPAVVSWAGMDPTRSAPAVVSRAGTDPTRSAPAVVSRAGTDPTRSAPSFVSKATTEPTRPALVVPTIRGTTTNAGGSLSPLSSAVAAPRRSSFAIPRPGHEGFSTVAGAAGTPAAGASSLGGSFRSALSAPGPNSASFLGSTLSLGASAPEMTTVDAVTPAAAPRAAGTTAFVPSERFSAASAKPSGLTGSAASGVAPTEGRFPSEVRAASARASSPSSLRGPAPASSTTASFPSEAAPLATVGASAFVPAAVSGVGESRSYWPSEKRRGELRQSRGGYLRFRFPSTARWWTPTNAVARADAGAASLAAGTPSATSGTEYAPSGTELVGHGAVTPYSASSSVVPTLGGAFGLGGAGAAVVASSSEKSAATPGASAKADAVRTGYRISNPNAPSYFPSERRAHEQVVRINRSTGARDNEAAFVALGPNGEATVMGPAAVAQLQSRKLRGGPGSVDMTVVASIAPQAPSLESMALAGHERPHAKGKKEGQAKSGLTKNDSLSLQGTVDSLAQRIYHRLKRRLAADRERFGG